METPAFPRQSFYGLTYEHLSERLAAWSEPSFRVDQVWRWLYHSLITDTEEMRNVPHTLRERLAESFAVRTIRPVRVQASRDRATRKWLMQLSDGETIETVLMCYPRRRTACISVQVGCALGCAFCATGQMGLHRNLDAGEIVEQVIFVERFLRKESGSRERQITNVVFMGMGEPLANYASTLRAVRNLNDRRGFGLANRRITLSTVGLVPGIRRLADEGLEVGLAISLHAATDELRDKLVPINRKFPLDPLFAACREYIDRTGRRITFEYALIRDVNDRPLHARQLAGRLRGLLCHVNLIPLNPVASTPFEAPPRGQVDRFRETLEQAGIAVTVRMRRGVDIQAGCGQLHSGRASRVSDVA